MSEVTSPAQARASGRSIAALVLGILSLVLCCAPFSDFILGLIALILGVIEWRAIDKGMASEAGKGFAIAGAITGGAGVLKGILSILFWIIYGAAIFTQLMQAIWEARRSSIQF